MAQSLLDIGVALRQASANRMNAEANQMNAEVSRLNAEANLTAQRTAAMEGMLSVLKFGYEVGGDASQPRELRAGILETIGNATGHPISVDPKLLPDAYADMEAAMKIGEASNWGPPYVKAMGVLEGRYGGPGDKGIQLDGLKKAGLTAMLASGSITDEQVPTLGALLSGIKFPHEKMGLMYAQLIYTMIRTHQEQLKQPVPLAIEANLRAINTELKNEDALPAEREQLRNAMALGKRGATQETDSKAANRNSQLVTESPESTLLFGIEGAIEKWKTKDNAYKVMFEAGPILHQDGEVRRHIGRLLDNVTRREFTRVGRELLPSLPDFLQFKKRVVPGGRMALLEDRDRLEEQGLPVDFVDKQLEQLELSGKANEILIKFAEFAQVPEEAKRQYTDIPDEPTMDDVQDYKQIIQRMRVNMETFDAYRQQGRSMQDEAIDMRAEVENGIRARSREGKPLTIREQLDLQGRADEESEARIAEEFAAEGIDPNDPNFNKLVADRATQLRNRLTEQEKGIRIFPTPAGVKALMVAKEQGKKVISTVPITMPNGKPGKAAIVQDSASPNDVSILQVETPEGTVPARTETTPLISMGSPAERKALIETRSTLDRLNEVEKLYNPDYVGPLDQIKGWIYSAAGVLSPQQADFQAKVNAFELEYRNRIFGSALSAGEKEEALKAILNLKQFDQNFEATLREAKRYLQKVEKMEAENVGRGTLAEDRYQQLIQEGKSQEDAFRIMFEEGF